MKKSGLLFLCMFSFVSFMFFVSASISLTEPNRVYNLGDKLVIGATVNPSSVVDGFFVIDLVCGENVMNFYKVPANIDSFPVGEEYTYSSYITLNRNFLTNLSNRNCAVVASLGEEKVSSNPFIISNSIMIKSNLDKLKFDPSESITLNVEATKENGYPLNGYLEVKGNIASFKKSIVNGKVTETFLVPKTKEAGAYTLELSVYDVSDSGEILNSGDLTLPMEVNQVASYIETTLGSVEVNSGENIEFALDLYDQSGKKMENNLLVSNVISPNGDEKKISSNSGEKIVLELPKNATPGKWVVNSFYSDVYNQVEFKVLQNPLVDFELINNSLIIRNVGNTVYNKTINVRIGDRIEKLDLNMQIGEERKFRLAAPQGEYDILVEDGKSNVQQTMFLTGKAVSVSEFDGAGIFSSHPLILIFFIIIFGGFATVLFFRFGKVTDLGNKLTQIRRKSNSVGVMSSGEYFVDVAKMVVTSAESTPVLNGQRVPSAMVWLKIFNYSRLIPASKAFLDNLVRIVNDRKGTIDVKEDGFLMIFSPLVTKTYTNEKSAMGIASLILEKLNGYNDSSSDKIVFNIAVHSGDLISTIEKKTLKYTSMDNCVLLLKKMVDSSKGQIIISDNIKRKLIRELKTTSTGMIGKSETYSVSEFLDKQGDKKKLDGMLDRMEQESSKQDSTQRNSQTDEEEFSF